MREVSQSGVGVRRKKRVCANYNIKQKQVLGKPSKQSSTME